MFTGFLKFLKEYKIVSLVVAFVMGEASSSLVNSLIKDVFLPLVSPLLSAESWRDAAFHVGSVTIAYGTLLADIINFVILAFLIFVVARKFLEMEKNENK